MKKTKPKKKLIEVAPKPPSVLIATPMYGGQCSGVYVQGLLTLQAALQARGIASFTSFLFNESLITRARNSLVHQFLKTDCTHLLFIDSDIRFDGFQVVQMLDHDKDIICGIYPKKEINWGEVKAASDRGVPVENLKHFTGAWVVNLVDYQASVTVPINEPMEIWNGGTGMMLINRRVFEKLAKQVPSYSNNVTDLSGANKVGEPIKEFFATSIEPETNILLSEDYHFCKLWRDAGGKVYAAPWVQLGHLGSYLFEGFLVANE